MKRIKLSVLALSIVALCCCVQTAQSSSIGAADNEQVSASDNVIETIMTRRSIRKYKPQPISRDTLNQILKCGVFAPNGMHRESWEIRVIDNPQALNEIDSLYNASQSRPRQAFFGAPVVVLIAYDTTYDLSQVDCGLLGENMILAAQSMGIGSCCLGGIARFLGTPQAGDWLKRLKLPGTHKLLYAIVFGYPDETPASQTRNMNKIQYID